MKNSTSRWVRVFAIFCLARWVAPCAVGAASITLSPPTGSGGPMGVTVSGLEQPMLLQRSTDMFNWDSLFVIAPSFNGLKMAESSASLANRSYYRLKPLDEPLKLKLNLAPGTHLGTIVSGRDVEIDIFGTKDEEGIPKSVRAITYRVGERLYVTQQAQKPQAGVGPEPLGEKNIYPYSYFEGLVAVDIEPGCIYVPPVPRVDYISREVMPDGTSKEVRGEAKTHFDPSGTQNRPVYRYSVPYHFSVTRPPGTLDRALRGLEAGIKEWAEFDEVDWAAGAVVLGAIIFSEGGAIIVVGVNRYRGLSLGILGALSGIAYSDDSPVGQTQVIWATETHLRAYIPSGANHYIYASAPAIELNPSPDDPGPTLVIDVPCGNNLQAIAVGSHIRTMNSVSENGVPLKERHILKLLDTVPDSLFGGNAEHGFPFGRATSSINLISWPSIAFRSRMEVEAGASTLSTAKTDGKLFFRVVPTTGMLEGASTEIEIHTDATGSGYVSGTLNSGGQSLRQVIGRQTVVMGVRVGTVYDIDYFSLLSTGSVNPGSADASLTLSLLGFRRN